MEISPSEDRLQIRPDPDPDEAAAISAAIALMLEREAKSATVRRPRRAWEIVGRIEAVSNAPGKLTDTQINDPWRAAER